MKLRKAIKLLESKGSGFVFKISEMEQNYNPEKFVEEIQTHGFALFYSDSSDKYSVRAFELFGSGFPYSYLDFTILKPEVEMDDEQKNNDGWGYYTFTQLYKKFNGTLPINFGIHSVVHKSTEADISLYRS